VVSVNALGGGAATLQSVKRDLNYSEELSGSRKQRMDIDTTEIDHGYKLGDTVQMAMKGDAALYRPIYEARNKEEREAAIAAISSKIGRDIAPYWAQSGINQDESHASATVGVGTKRGGGEKQSFTEAAGWPRPTPVRKFSSSWGSMSTPKPASV